MDVPADPSAIAPAELLARSGQEAGARRPLLAPVTVVGSGPGCDVRLDDPSVQHVHCVIALTPAGPHMRSLDAADTFVNGEPINDKLLHDGDVLKVGLFEFELRWSVPLAEAVDAPEGSATPDARDRLHDWRRQLAAARLRFRREKSAQEADLAGRLEQFAAARADLERREAEAAREHARLDRLRTRFLKRWKRHWSARRERLEGELDRVKRARVALEAERAAFAHEVDAFRDHEEVQTRRIEYGWDQLRAAEKRTRADLACASEEIDRRRRAAADAEARLKAGRAALDAERLRVEHHSSDLRLEADGLESRVVNLRAVLLRLEAQRAPFPDPSVPVEATPPTEAAPADVDAGERRAELERLAGEIADQRLALAEQIDRLAAAREQWRAEEARVVEEMAALAEGLRLREERLAEDEKAAAFDRDGLEKELASVRQERERLAARQARLESRTAAERAERERTGTELRLRAAGLERREAALGELYRKQSQLRRKEVEQLRAEHRRCQKLRMEWAAQRAGFEQRERDLQARLGEVAARALLLEQERQTILRSLADPELAEARLERLGRHVRAAAAKSAATLDQKWRELLAERTALEDLYRKAAAQVEAATVKERELADRTAGLEHREALADAQEREFAAAEQLRLAAAAAAERERATLRDEVERLAGLLLESASDGPAPLMRAA
jgi:hypothetical protein